MLAQVHAKRINDAAREGSLKRAVKRKSARPINEAKLLKDEEERVAKQLLDSQILVFSQDQTPNPVFHQERAYRELRRRKEFWHDTPTLG